MDSRPGVTTGLRRFWLLSGLVLVAGTFVPGGGEVLAVPGLLLLAVAAGATAGRGHEVGSGWRWLSWAVPVLPTTTTAGFLAYLAVDGAGSDVVSLVIVLLGGVSVLVWVGFGVAYAVARTRQRSRRRFGAAAPAWENDRIPPSYS